MPNFLGLTVFLQAAPPAPSNGYSWGIWYVLVVVAAVAFVAFWVLKRISDIAARRKTATMIREIGEAKEPDCDANQTQDGEQ